MSKLPCEHDGFSVPFRLIDGMKPPMVATPGSNTLCLRAVHRTLLASPELFPRLEPTICFLGPERKRRRVDAFNQTACPIKTSFRRDAFPSGDIPRSPAEARRGKGDVELTLRDRAE